MLSLGAHGTSADAPNIVAIGRAVHDIALNQSGVNWGGDNIWDFPTVTQWATASKPFLVTAWPKLASYAEEGQPRGKELIRMMGGATAEIEPLWDYVVWAIYDFTAGDPNTYEAPLADLAKLHQAFTIFYGAEDTCAYITIVDPSFQVLEPIPGQKFASVRLTIRAYEVLEVNYTQPL